MKSSLVFGACIVVCLVGSLKGYSSQCSSRANGCSIPYNLPYFYKKSFTPACNKHDVCYACGAARGISKSACDRKLWSDTKAVCARHGHGRRDVEERSVVSHFCKLVSYSYYEAVKLFGASRYSRSCPSWCRQRWVRRCLP